MSEFSPHSTENFQEDWLSGYLDGELTREQREKVVRAISKSQKLSILIKELEANRQLVQGLPQWPKSSSKLASKFVVTDTGDEAAQEIQRQPWTAELEDGLHDSAGGVVEPTSSARFFGCRPAYLLALTASLIGIGFLSAMLWVASDFGGQLGMKQEQSLESQQLPELKSIPESKPTPESTWVPEPTREMLEAPAGSVADYGSDSGDRPAEAAEVSSLSRSRLSPAVPTPSSTSATQPPEAGQGRLDETDVDRAKGNGGLPINWHRTESWSEQQVRQQTPASAYLRARSEPIGAFGAGAEDEPPFNLGSNLGLNAREGRASEPLPKDSSQPVAAYEMILPERSYTEAISALEFLDWSPPLEHDSSSSESQELVLFLSKDELEVVLNKLEARNISLSLQKLFPPSSPMAIDSQTESDRALSGDRRILILRSQ